MFGPGTDSELAHDLANVEICQRAARLFAENPNRVIKFECFNEKEAEWFERFMAARYPEVKFFTSYLVFKDRRGD